MADVTVDVIFNTTDGPNTKTSLALSQGVPLYNVKTVTYVSGTGFVQLFE